jgi:hypothetical protein
MLLRQDAAARVVENFLDTRDCALAALRNEDHSMPAVRPQKARKVQILPGKVLVDQQNFHGVGMAVDWKKRSNTALQDRVMSNA